MNRCAREPHASQVDLFWNAALAAHSIPSMLFREQTQGKVFIWPMGKTWQARLDGT